MEALYAGPWSWDGSYPIRIVDYAGYIVCEGIMPARSRDARLITAAPDLLEALQEAADRIDGIKGGSVSDTVALMRAAIAKATETADD